MKEIIQGATNKLLNNLNISDKEIEKIAKQRLKICDTCKLKDYHLVKKEICSVCGCKLQWMSRSNKECSKGYWKEGKVTIEDLKENNNGGI